MQDEAAQLAKTKGHDFASGKSIFKVATCVACHKLNGEGSEFGPDLAKLDPKWVPLDVLTHIVDPSAKINEKFQTCKFSLKKGTTARGIILEETSAEYKVIENPLVSTAAITIKKSELDDDGKTKITSSLMPKGLLDKLNRARFSIC